MGVDGPAPAQVAGVFKQLVREAVGGGRGAGGGRGQGGGRAQYMSIRVWVRAQRTVASWPGGWQWGVSAGRGLGVGVCTGAAATLSTAAPAAMTL